MKTVSKMYESPIVEIIDVTLEQGFAASNGAGNSPLDNENWS